MVTDDRKDTQGDTRGVEFDRAAWEDAVQQAAVERDESALTSLFQLGQAHLGAQVGQEWARILSALDAGAVTG